MVKLTVPLGDGRVMTYEGTEQEVMNIGKAYENGSAPVDTGTKVEIVVWTKQSARTFVDLLYGDQHKLLQFLVQRGGAAPYADVEAYMGYRGQRLAGVLSSLTRNAKKATAMEQARVLEWRGVPGNYEYFVDPKALPFFLELLK
ncbi:MAG TPA: hypothetical protein VE135_26210 [Pyrinomonadaceae bacterium]|nr:hypothetical protein [Pyrinomonadaceae bacterium]